MYENTNVKIPVVLLLETINLLETIDFGLYDYATQEEVEFILYSLRKKKEALALREAYAKIIYAKDDDSRHSFRMQYLQKKRELNKDFGKTHS